MFNKRNWKKKKNTRNLSCQFAFLKQVKLVPTHTCLCLHEANFAGNKLGSPEMQWLEWDSEWLPRETQARHALCCLEFYFVTMSHFTDTHTNKTSCLQMSRKISCLWTPIIAMKISCPMVFIEFKQFVSIKPNGDTGTKRRWIFLVLRPWLIW